MYQFCNFFIGDVQIESLEADKDISSQQLSTMKAKLDQYKEPNEDDVISNLKSMESDSENDGKVLVLQERLWSWP